MRETDPGLREPTDRTEEHRDPRPDQVASTEGEAVSARLALEVLDRQVDVLRWLGSERGATTFVEMAESFQRSTHDFGLQNMDVFAETYHQNLSRATTYWVSPTMTDLVEHAWKTLPYTEITAAEVPSEVGWVEFSRTLRVPQEHDDPLHGLEPGFDAVSWWVQPDNIIVLERDGERSVAGVTVMWWRRTHGFEEDTMAWTPDPTTEDFEALDYYRVVTRGTPFVPCFATGWAFGYDPNREGYSTSLAGQMQRQSLHALWLLLGQQLPAMGRVRPARGQARRIGRALGDVPEVITVDLRRQRRPTDPVDDGEPEHWSHRWIVSGHWRNQWYPSLQAHRPVWIFPYEKGPEGKPLVVKDRVYRLVR